MYSRFVSTECKKLGYSIIKKVDYLKIIQQSNFRSSTWSRTSLPPQTQKFMDSYAKAFPGIYFQTLGLCLSEKIIAYQMKILFTTLNVSLQDSQLSSSRNDSSSINSNSTNTWRMSRSSVSSAMSHSLGRAGSNKNPDGLGN